MLFSQPAPGFAHKAQWKGTIHTCLRMEVLRLCRQNITRLLLPANVEPFEAIPFVRIHDCVDAIERLLL